ncbi:MAG: hypothetical protein J6W96_01055 [Alphaproteobacteria bacterium]|nr:hypothetical protein [Alphaproteobacteria bacterium]
MSNNTPDYNDNLYFDCILGDNDLTAQWRKGELPEGLYYVENNEGNIGILGWSKFAGWYNIKQVLAPVPSYQWVIDHSFKPFSQRLFEKTLEDNKKLKELLKECELWFTGIVGNMNDKNVGEHNRNLPIGNFEHIFKVFSQKINEVLKCGNIK